jgi:hypothetical protein
VLAKICLNTTEPELSAIAILLSAIIFTLAPVSGSLVSAFLIFNFKLDWACMEEKEIKSEMHNKISDFIQSCFKSIVD